MFEYDFNKIKDKTPKICENCNKKTALGKYNGDIALRHISNKNIEYDVYALQNCGEIAIDKNNEIIYSMYNVPNSNGLTIFCCKGSGRYVLTVRKISKSMFTWSSKLKSKDYSVREKNLVMRTINMIGDFSFAFKIFKDCCMNIAKKCFKINY